MEQAQESTPESSTPFADALRRAIAEEGGEPVEDSPTEPEQAQEAEAPEQESPQEAEQPEAEQAQPTGVEVEIDGKQYTVPPELKDGYLRQADYSRKTQELARDREGVTRERESIQQAATALTHLWPVIGELTATQAYLNRLGNLDWNSLQQNDPIEHNRLRLEAIEAQNKLGHLAAQVNDFGNKYRHMQYQSIAEETQRNLPKALELVPDLEQRKGEFVAVGKSYGYDETELLTLTDPRAIAALRDLAEYRKLIANRDTVKQKVANVPQVVAKPGSKAVPAPNVDLKKAMHALKTDNSDDAFVAAMRAQRKGGRL